MSKLRQGDLYLNDTPDGAEIINTNGEPVMDAGLETAVYISIYGEEGDPGWMTEYQGESEKLKCKFYNFIKGNNKTISNIRKGELLLLDDLSWFKKDGIADKINISIVSTDRNKILIKVEMLADGETIFKNNYNLNWFYQKNLPASGRI